MAERGGTSWWQKEIEPGGSRERWYQLMAERGDTSLWQKEVAQLMAEKRMNQLIAERGRTRWRQRGGTSWWQNTSWYHLFQIQLLHHEAIYFNTFCQQCAPFCHWFPIYGRKVIGVRCLNFQNENNVWMIPISKQCALSEGEVESVWGSEHLTHLW